MCVCVCVLLNSRGESRVLVRRYIQARSQGIHQLSHLITRPRVYYISVYREWPLIAARIAATRPLLPYFACPGYIARHFIFHNLLLARFSLSLSLSLSFLLSALLYIHTHTAATFFPRTFFSPHSLGPSAFSFPLSYALPEHLNSPVSPLQVRARLHLTLFFQPSVDVVLLRPFSPSPTLFVPVVAPQRYNALGTASCSLCLSLSLSLSLSCRVAISMFGFPATYCCCYSLLSPSLCVCDLHTRVYIDIGIHIKVCMYMYVKQCRVYGSKGALRAHTSPVVLGRARALSHFRPSRTRKRSQL